MARIRTIKPEFPQSESMGNVSRDARLTFIQLWTLADDEGRLRGNSRMLASLLFPYDDDAKDGIEGWIEELERENCVVRYRVDGATYIQIQNWAEHQKIDKPSKSKLPEFKEENRISSGYSRERSALSSDDSENPRESSRILPVGVDQGRDQGREVDPGCAELTEPLPPAVEILPAVAEAPATQVAVRKQKAEAEKTPLQIACRETWEAYSLAYAKRYGVAPLRDAKVNSQVKQIVERLGAEEGPQIAAWYVSHPGAFYMQRGHDLGQLLTDAGKLRTEWATGRVMTSTAARQSDRRGAMASAVSNLLAECGGEA